MGSYDIDAESARLEDLWAGEFGDDYVKRNAAVAAGREHFWNQTLDKLEVGSALEVGCNVGANLRWLVERLETKNVAGVDVNGRAVEAVREEFAGIDARACSARSLPFDDGSFDLVFTMGVLIRQPPAALEDIMREIIRCSRGYVLCGEYFSETPVEVPYRGQEGALFKRDFGGLYKQLAPDLQLVDDGFLSGPAWDDVTYWVYAKP